ncbi:MAG: divergent PAP2 family protein [Candidatus Omnitrophota bacterium]
MTITSPPFEATRGILAIFLSWLIAQLIKVIRGGFRERKFNFKWLIRSGGMPSAHSATVACLTTVVAMYYGLDSIPFAISIVFSFITMFDAAGVRRNVGRQASILNKMLEEVYEGRDVPEKQIKALLGHTPIEVMIGAAMGVVLALVICKW